MPIKEYKRVGSIDLASLKIIIKTFSQLYCGGMSESHECTREDE